MAPINMITSSTITMHHSETLICTSEEHTMPTIRTTQDSSKRPSDSLTVDESAPEPKVIEQKRRRSTSVKREPAEMKFRDFYIRKKYVKPPKSTDSNTSSSSA